ncbi:MAG: class I SAM-dependent methyltransferase [Burkholderiales bacterium]
MAFDPVWEEIFRSQAWGKYPGEDLIRFVARNFYRVQDRSAVRILEVGCGPGANLWYMAREGFSVYGIDGSATAIAQAKFRLDSECPGWTGDLKVGDIGTLDFEDGMFDAVIDNEAIYANSFENSIMIYSALARVCKPGAKLFSRTFAKGCWGDGTGKPVGHNAWIAAEGPLKDKGLSRFTEFSEIPELITGFEITEIELLTRTMNDRKHEVREWLIVGEKIS